MKVSTLRENGNSLMLFTVLVLNSIYQSEIGGPGTFYNTASFLIGVCFLLLNRRYRESLLILLGLPLLFLWSSVIVNSATLSSGGFRSSLATAVGYLMLAMKPIRLNGPLMKKLMVVYLVSSLALSMVMTAVNLTAGLEAAFGNPNFNINPNSAALYLFSCVVLALVFTTGTLQMVLSIGFYALSLTTGSRAVLVVGAALSFAYVFFSTGFSGKSVMSDPFVKRRVLWIAGFASVPTLAAAIVPGSFQYLLSRLAAVGLSTGGLVNDGRDVKWAHALTASLHSLTTIFFGYGPAMAADVISSGTHSSYVEAFTSIGWPFMLSSVVAMAGLCYYHLRAKQPDAALFIAAICLYGGTETVLFNGFGNIWFVLILVSLYYRSVPAPMPETQGA